MNMESSIPIHANYSSLKEYPGLSDHTPREYLTRVIQQDKGEPSLGKWFSEWIDDLAKLQQDILQNIEKQKIQI